MISEKLLLPASPVYYKCCKSLIKNCITIEPISILPSFPVANTLFFEEHLAPKNVRLSIHDANIQNTSGKSHELLQVIVATGHCCAAVSSIRLPFAEILEIFGMEALVLHECEPLQTFIHSDDMSSKFLGSIWTSTVMSFRDLLHAPADLTLLLLHLG